MNLIDAVKSGRPFKRKNYGDFFFLTGSWRLTKEDILADDWEIQEPEVRVTRTQFREAFGEVLEQHWKDRGGLLEFEQGLARRLGLETP